METTSKQGAVDLCRVMLEQGVDTVVICPGSRNAPLIRAFVDLGFRTHSVVDERSAAFVAMGMAQASKKPVAVCCTSGSASTNFYPAVVEAFYQRVPLVVITADRPPNQVDVGDGQAIHQPGLYAEHVVREIHFDGELEAPGTLAEVITAAQLEHGPVQVNVAFEEPLYAVKEWNLDITPQHVEHVPASFDGELPNKRTLVVCCQEDPDPQVNQLLERISVENKAVVLSELLSNQSGKGFVTAIDRMMLSMSDEEKQAWMPERVVTLGGALVTRHFKGWLRTGDFEHIQLGTRYPEIDFFGQGVQKIDSTLGYLEKLAEQPSQEEYCSPFHQRNAQLEKMQQEFMASTQWSDMTVTKQLSSHFKPGDLIHLGNSSLVRYFLLHGPSKGVEYVGNRGVSGIDGTLSTAVGQALAQPERIVFCILGDLSFVYDSNALWNRAFPSNLKIVVIDNGGGDIFRIIPGPRTYAAGEEFQASHHPVDYLKLAEAYGVKACSCSDAVGFEKNLDSLRIGECTLLRVDTSAVENHEVILEYFQESRKA